MDLVNGFCTRENVCSGHNYVVSVGPDQTAYSCTLIRAFAVRLQKCFSESDMVSANASMVMTRSSNVHLTGQNITFYPIFFVYIRLITVNLFATTAFVPSIRCQRCCH